MKAKIMYTYIYLNVFAPPPKKLPNRLCYLPAANSTHQFSPFFQKNSSPSRILKVRKEKNIIQYDVYRCFSRKSTKAFINTTLSVREKYDSCLIVFIPVFFTLRNPTHTYRISITISNDEWRYSCRQRPSGQRPSTPCEGPTYHATPDERLGLLLVSCELR